MVKHRSFRLTQASVADLGHRPSLGMLALVGFVVSLIVHASTFFSIVPPGITWLLHVGIFIVFIPMILTWNRLAMSRQAGRSVAEARCAHANRFPNRLMLWWRSVAEARRAQSELFKQSMRTVPAWVTVACILCFSYAMLNIGLLIVNTKGYAPAREGNHYYLVYCGTKIRDVSAEEFHQFEAYEFRGFSGHWMLFYLIPAVFFLYVEPRAREILEVEDQQQSPHSADQSGKSDFGGGSSEQKSHL